MDGAYTDEGFKEFLEEHADEGGNSELLRWRKQIESSLNIKPMSKYQNQPIYKVVVMSPGMEQVKNAKQRIGENFQFCVQGKDQYGMVNGEILKNTYNKGVAVEKVCEQLGISILDTVAFGDSMNDIEMR